MKRKIIVICLICCLIGSAASIAYAAWANLAVRRLAPAAAVATAAGGYKIPAYVGGATTAGLTAYSWIALALPGAGAAAVAGAALAVAGSATLDYIMNNAPEWFAEKNYVNDGDGIARQYTTTFPTGANPADFADGANEGGMLESAYAASLACEDHRSYSGVSCAQSSVCQNMATEVPASVAAKAGVVGWWCYYLGVKTNYLWYYPKPGVDQDPPVTNRSPVTPGAVKNALQTDLVNLNKASARKVADAGLQVAANMLDDPNHPLNQDAVQRAAILAAFNAAISSSQSSTLEGTASNFDDTTAGNLANPGATALTPGQIAAAVQQALQGQGLNAAQIAAAIAAAQQAAAGGLTQAQAQAAIVAALSAAGVSANAIGAATAAALASAGLATNAGVQTAVKDAIETVLPPIGAYVPPGALAPWAKPEVGDFAGLFSRFLDDMRNTPLFSLPGLLSSAVPAGGDCEYSINLSDRFGGAKTFSMCNWSTGLSAVKAALLCVVSILAVGIVTKGGS